MGRHPALAMVGCLFLCKLALLHPVVGAQQIAFTFDDLPAHGTLPENQSRLEIANAILKTLHTEHLPPTYGLINGKTVEADPTTLAVLKAWRAAGNPLGSHTWSHMNFDEHTSAEFEADIAKNEPLLASLMPGEDWHWFRYPYLWEGDKLEKRHAARGHLSAHGYKIAQVTMDFEDYLWNAPYARCVAQHDDKSIEYLHKTYLAAAEGSIPVFRQMSQMVYGHDIPYVLLMHIGAFDARMLPELIALYRAKGFTFVSLPEAEKDAAYAADPDMALHYGGTPLDQMMAAKKLSITQYSKPTRELEALCR